MEKSEHPLKKLTAFIEAIKIDKLPQEVRQAANDCLIDTAGAAIGALDSGEIPEVLNTMLAYSGSPQTKCPGSSIWGTRHYTSVFQASFLNGTLSHTLELDDVHTASKTHIGAVVIPAAWSVAEAVNATGIELIEAIVAGYETMARIGRGFGVTEHRLMGWHVTGTAGTFGAAAAAAKLLKLSPEQTLSALGIAGTQSSGVWAFLEDGATSKKMHTGRAAENGVVAAFLAKAGMTGPNHILDASDGGLYRLMSSAGDVEQVSNELGTVFEILRVDKKPYPCCRSIHPAIDAILSVRKEKCIASDQVKRIKIRSYEVGVKQCGVILYPTNVAEAGFSMRYGVAVAYIDGAAGKEQFSSDRINDPKVRELAERIDYVADEEFTARYPKSWGCSVEILFQDGASVSRDILDASGSFKSPMTRKQLEDKFKGLVSNFMEEDEITAVCRNLEKIEQTESIAGILSSRKKC